ncbi:MAG: hypothetical protein GX893_06950 [Firmicutes bacterium]|nr:hypothetical protein [Bacillota bacterium]
MKYDGAEHWVSVFEAATWEEAAMIKGVLEAAKIPVMLDRDSLNKGYSLSLSVMSEVLIKVSRNMASRAAHLLHSKSFNLSHD